MDAHLISKLELRWQEEVCIKPERYLDFIVDGHRLTERIPWRDLRVRLGGLNQADERFNRALPNAGKFFALVTRLGKFQPRWWRDALAESNAKMAISCGMNLRITCRLHHTSGGLTSSRSASKSRTTLRVWNGREWS